MSLVAITSHEDRGVPGLEMLAVQKRGLDEQWLTRNDRDEQVLVMLLPLTDETGASGCKARLEQLLRSVHHEGAHSNPYTFQVETLGVKDQAQQVLGIGANGHIAFNEPPEPGEEMSSDAFAALPTRRRS